MESDEYNPSVNQLLTYLNMARGRKKGAEEAKEAEEYAERFKLTEPMDLKDLSKGSWVDVLNATAKEIAEAKEARPNGRGIVPKILYRDGGLMKIFEREGVFRKRE
jgi:hypothetical protein